jgi:hypothetical protein
MSWSSRVRSWRRGRSPAQATVEYILLIAGVVLAILLMLFLFRDAVNALTDRVADWIVGQEMPEQSPSFVAAAPPPPPPATPDPVPSGTPEDSADWLVGTWCGPDYTWTATRVGPGLVRGQRIYPGGSRSPGDTFTITSLGNGRYMEASTTNPNDWVEIQRQPDGSFVTGRSAQGGYPTTYRRC